MVDMVNQNVIFSNENDSHMFIFITHEFPLLYNCLDLIVA